jgi:hypothetical protein
MKKILLSLIISIYAFGDVPEKDGAAPQPNYQLHFPENEEQDSTKSMVGDDDLKQNKIEYGIGYENDVGISFEKEVDRTMIKNNNKDKVYVILDKFLDKRVYEVSDTFYINNTGLNGKYTVYVKIKDKLYRTDYYIEV